MFDAPTLNRRVSVDEENRAWHGGWDPAESSLLTSKGKTRSSVPGGLTLKGELPLSRTGSCGHDVGTYRPHDNAWQLFECTARSLQDPASPCRGRMTLVELQRQPFAASLAQSVVGLPCHHVIAQLRFTFGALQCATCDAQVALLGATISRPLPSQPLEAAVEPSSIMSGAAASTAHIPPGVGPNFQREGDA